MDKGYRVIYLVSLSQILDRGKGTSGSPLVSDVPKIEASGSSVRPSEPGNQLPWASQARSAALRKRRRPAMSNQNSRADMVLQTWPRGCAGARARAAANLSLRAHLGARPLLTAEEAWGLRVVTTG